MEKVTYNKKLLDEVNHKIKNMSGNITIKAAAYTCATRDIKSIRKFLEAAPKNKSHHLLVSGIDF